MSDFQYEGDTELLKKLQRNFAEKIVRKDFTKRILAENYVKPDEAQKIIAKLHEKGTYAIIDHVFVHLNIREDIYKAEFSNLGIKQVPIAESYI